MEHFITSLNAALPFFIVMALGWFIVRIRLVDSRFIDGLNNLVFRLFIPAILFRSIYSADLTTAFDGALIAYCTTGTVILFALFWLAGHRFLAGGRLATFVQASYRGNYIIFATPLIGALMGADALPKAVLMAPFMVALYSVLAAVVFTVSVGGAESGSGGSRAAAVLIRILTMPFIVAVLLALAVNLLGISLPGALDASVGYVADMGTPAALLGIGGAMSAEKVRANLKLALLATAMKNIVVPLAMIVPAVMLGFSGLDLAIIATMGLAPTALNSYSTARSLGGDGDMAASCLVFSTASSLVTIVLGLTILRSLGLI